METILFGPPLHIFSLLFTYIIYVILISPAVSISMPSKVWYCCQPESKFFVVQLEGLGCAAEFDTTRPLPCCRVMFLVLDAFRIDWERYS